MNNPKINDFLLRVNHPVYYTGDEINAIYRNSDDFITGILMTPGNYFDGMADDMFRRLYVLLNKSAKIYWQRSFLPDLKNDFDVLTDLQLPLFSIENNDFVKDADILLLYVKDVKQYLFFHHLFKAIGISLFTADRRESEPVVIAFGPGLINPLPISPFIDAAAPGDPEMLLNVFDQDVLLPFIKKDFLEKLAKRDGIHVTNGGDKTEKSKNLTVSNLPQLSGRYYPPKLPIPHIDIRQKPYRVEIARGTFSGIRSDVDDFIRRPLRIRRVEDVVLEIKNAVRYEGARVFEIVAPHAEEYDNLIALIKRLKVLSAELGFRFFISGFLFEPDSSLDDILKNVTKDRFHIPLYTVDPRLRNRLNLPATVHIIENMINRLISLGWEHFSFKVVLGLPGESEDSLKQLIEWLQKLSDSYHEYPQLSFVIETDYFVPQPFNPLQWETCESVKTLEKRTEYLITNLRNKRFSVRHRNFFEIPVETILYRSDESLAELLNIDLREIESWDEKFTKDGQARKLNALSLYDDLPWQQFDFGVSSSFIQEERMKALDNKPTPSCLIYACNNCGLQRAPFKDHNKCYVEAAEHPRAGKYDHVLRQFTPVEEKVINYGRGAKKRDNPTQQLVKKLRIEYIKKGKGRFYNHQDIGRLIDYAAKISGFPLAYSQGKIPRAKMSFGPPLQTGYESDGEYIDVEILVLQESDMMEKINRLMPAGIVIKNAMAIYKKVPSLLESVNEVIYEVNFGDNADAAQTLFAELNVMKTTDVEILSKPGTEQEERLKTSEYVKELEKRENRIYLNLKVESGKTVRLNSMLEMTSFDFNIANMATITRTKQRHIDEAGNAKSPLEMIL